MEAQRFAHRIAALLQGQVDKNLPIPIQEEATQTHPFLSGHRQGARAGRHLLVPVKSWVSGECQGPRTSATPSQAVNLASALQRCSVLMKLLSEQL